MPEVTQVSAGLDDDVQPEAKPTEPPKRDDDGVPICPVHVCRMVAKSSGPKGSRKAYYGCRVDGCKERNAKIRDTRDQWPKQETLCSKCQTPMEYHIEVAKQLQGASKARLPLKCPKCGSTAEMTDPRLQSVMRQKPKTDTYGER